MRCNAVLQATAFTGSVNPPRMAKWKRPFRNMSRWFRLHVTLPAGPKGPLVKVPAVLKIMSGDAFLGLVLSIIPGLAQLIDGRFRKVLPALVVWFFALTGGVFFYGSSFGLLLLGLAVGLHSWIGYEHVLSKEKVNALVNVHILLSAIFILTLFYWGIRRTVFRDYVFDYTALTIPGQNIQSGDLLLGRRSLSGPDNLHRGSFVAARIKNVQGGDYNRASTRTARMAVQIVGLPGEKIVIDANSFIVNDSVLDSNDYPVPKWLRNHEIIAISVPEDSFFVNTVYNVQVRGGNIEMYSALVQNACVIQPAQIQAKAIMLWNPVSRRCFLKEDK
jgi:hypothetical protein